MAIYAAMIERMDAGVGRILAELKDLGKADTPSSFSCLTTAVTRKNSHLSTNRIGKDQITCPTKPRMGRVTWLWGTAPI